MQFTCLLVSNKDGVLESSEPDVRPDRERDNCYQIAAIAAVKITDARSAAARTRAPVIAQFRLRPNGLGDFRLVSRH